MYCSYSVIYHINPLFYYEFFQEVKPFDTMSWIVHCIFKGSRDRIAKFRCKVDVISANIADPDKIPRSVTFYLGLRRLSKYPLKGVQHTKG